MIIYVQQPSTCVTEILYTMLKKKIKGCYPIYLFLLNER